MAVAQQKTDLQAQARVLVQACARAQGKARGRKVRKVPEEEECSNSCRLAVDMLL